METHSSGVNRVYLLGKVLGQPERTTRDGRAYLNLTLLTMETVGRNEKARTVEEIHQVLIAEKVPGAENIGEGDRLYIKGKIQTRVVVDEAGVKRYRTEIFAASCQPMD